MERSRWTIAGFSLVELMVAMLAGLIVSAAVLSFFMSSMQSNGAYVQSTRLTQELRNTMDLVTRDLRRAGYNQDGLAHLATNTASPFGPILLPVGSQISSGPPATYSCIIYAYDRPNRASSSPADQLGQVNVGNGEVRGLRHRTRTVGGRSIGVVEYAESSGTTRPNCAGAAPDYSAYPVACKSSTWCPQSDYSQIDVTAFALADRRSVVGTTVGERIQIRDFDVAITGRIAGSTEYTRNITSSVRIRSDCFDPAATGTNPAAFGSCSLTP